ncbi:MAG TPA: LamG domain-containing protein [Candidatus Moranbacteria bacterium]|nr:LamG domain-containing protein [Candidatus Moranbacteria bacterium]
MKKTNIIGVGVKHKIYAKKRKRGSVLVVSLILFGIIIVTALSVALSALRERKTSMQASKTNIAYQNADEGIDKVMTALLKGQKSYNPTSEKIEISSVLSQAKTGLSCVGTPNKLSKVNEYAVELLDSSGNHIDCGSTEDIALISQLKSVGSDNSVGTQRIVEANVSQKEKEIKLLLHADMADGSTNFVDGSRVHHEINPSGGMNINASSNTAPIVPNFGYLSFDGNDDYLWTNDVDEDWSKVGIGTGGTSAFTVDFWVKKDNTGNATQTMFYMKKNSTDILEIDYVQPDDLRIIFLGTTCDFTSSANIADSNWHHLAFVRDDDDNIKLYSGGKKLDSTPADCKRSGDAVPDNIMIGAKNGTQNFKGELDEVRLFADQYWTTEFDTKCPITATAPEVCKSY